ncbi:adenylosuccinate synthetase [Dyadobacter sandarakinus]|uniref:Adenylosuccinate synthetase n=1 Tax=Dyadobacter sandarakinus TaxID=2747268 RepID=A0ABX7I3M1_9BACT|nr:adenylosuccinate synthetase [Dyadobacter sandarakinus]QRR00480.1 adenylosuccinate synthetase [Dyadobacter sandarakinus]
MTATAHIVVGLGYGDEGKGIFTDYLSSRLRRPVVIRYNGGHQCGHSVNLRDGRSHVFSSFGSGTFRGVPTYISAFCTIDPADMLHEHASLRSLGANPVLLADPRALVVTPFDKLYHRLQGGQSDSHNPGEGFAACLDRVERGCVLHAADLFVEKDLSALLLHIRQYYETELIQAGYPDALSDLNQISIPGFLDEVRKATAFFQLVPEGKLFSGSGFSDFIFEGARGILLDNEFGIFPNAAKMSTTSKNAVIMIKRNLPDCQANLYYLTRAYQTRRGTGWMSTRNHPVKLTAERTTDRQVATGILDLDMVRYAMQCDTDSDFPAKKNLVVTCLDQLAGFVHFRDGRVIRSQDIGSYIYKIAVCNSIYLNASPYSDTFRYYSWES